MAHLVVTLVPSRDIRVTHSQGGWFWGIRQLLGLLPGRDEEVVTPGQAVLEGVGVR